MVSGIILFAQSNTPRFLSVHEHDCRVDEQLHSSWVLCNCWFSPPVAPPPFCLPNHSPQTPSLLLTSQLLQLPCLWSKTKRSRHGEGERSPKAEGALPWAERNGSWYQGQWLELRSCPVYSRVPDSSSTQKHSKHDNKVPKPDLAVPGYQGRGAGVKPSGFMDLHSKLFKARV